jgi:single-strand DNA-binding protein
MEIIGRITKDANVRTLKDNRKVVSFSIAMNDYYKTKDGEKKQLTTFVDCSYWVSDKIAKVLTKGCIVSLFGRISINQFKTKDGTFQANLSFHVNSIKIIHKPQAAQVAVEKDDLPF